MSQEGTGGARHHCTSCFRHTISASCAPSLSPSGRSTGRAAQGRAGSGEPDAEARAAAVRALTAVATELCRVDGRASCSEPQAPAAEPHPVSGAAPRDAAAEVAAEPHPSAPAVHGARMKGDDTCGPSEAQAAAAADGRAGCAQAAAAADLLLQVVPTLLAAMGDYATDARGDVGSWVRCL